MANASLEELLKKVESRYKLVIVAAQRAVELSDGGQRLVDISPKTKASIIALEEIKEGRVNYKEKQPQT